MPRNRGQSWPTFVRNHLHQTWAYDFLTIVTLRFQILYCFQIVDLARREIVHIGVTSSPSAQFAGQCFVEAVVDRDNENSRFMIRDRDSIYGKEFRRRVKSCGTRCLVTPPRSPKANAICERMNGTLRRDCPDPIIVRDDVHADRVLKEYIRYYHGRPHRGLRTLKPAPAHSHAISWRTLAEEWRCQPLPRPILAAVFGALGRRAALLRRTTILDSVARGRLEQKRILYLALGSMPMGRPGDADS